MLLAGVLEDEFAVVEPEEVEQGRLVVVRRHAIGDRSMADLVGFSVRDAPANPAAGQPDREALSVVVAAIPLRVAAVVLREARPGDQRLVGYVVPSGAMPEDSRLRDFLVEIPPPYPFFSLHFQIFLFLLLFFFFFFPLQAYPNLCVRVREIEKKRRKRQTILSMGGADHRQ